MCDFIEEVQPLKLIFLQQPKIDFVKGKINDVLVLQVFFAVHSL